MLRLRVDQVVFQGIPFKNGTWTRIEDVSPTKNGDIPLLCYFTRGYIYTIHNIYIYIDQVLQSEHPTSLKLTTVIRAPLDFCFV